MNPRASQFFSCVKLEHCRVQYPQDVVFLCGGLVSEAGSSFASLRDFLNKNRTLIFDSSQVLLAEKAAAAFDSKIFQDLLELEKQIAVVSRIVMLVSESPGSIAELGAFSQIPEISQKLLVFLHSNHYNSNSFIKDGPIRYLERIKEQSVQEFNWEVNRNNSIKSKGAQNLLPSFKIAADGFLKGQPQAESFKKDNVGHCIMLIAGIIFTLRCCKLREIVQSTELLGLKISESRIKQHIFCLKLVGWIKVVKRDVQYHVYDSAKAPIVFRGPGSSRDFSRFDPVRSGMIYFRLTKRTIRDCQSWIRCRHEEYHSKAVAENSNSEIGCRIHCADSASQVQSILDSKEKR